MSISKQISQDMVRGSWIRRMFEEGLRLKAEHGASAVFDFTLGNPYVEPPAEFFDALKEVVRNDHPGTHAYMPNSGYPATRRRVATDLAENLGLPFDENHIVMTVGAAGALNVALKSLLDQGDEVVVVAPYFPEYSFYIANHKGVKITSFADDSFLPSIEDLEKRIGPATRALILCSPCNPSGRLIPDEVLAGVGELLRRKSAQNGRTIYLLSDEPYRRLVFDGKVHASPALHYEETLIGMSHSKDLSLAGERIGYLAISPRCREASDIFAAATFANRVLGYVNAPALMQRVLQVIQSFEPPVAVYQRKRDILYNGLSGMGYDVVKPEGTFFMFPRSPLSDDQEFVKVLRRHLVLVTPGSGFEFPGYFRISFAVDDDVIERSLPAFRLAIEEVRG